MCNMWTYVKSGDTTKQSVCRWQFYIYLQRIIVGPKQAIFWSEEVHEEICIFPGCIYFLLTRVYISSSLLSSENIYGTSHSSWGTQWDFNSLVFPAWMVFSCLWVYVEVSPLFFWECMFTLACFTPNWSLVFDIFVSFCISTHSCGKTRKMPF